MSDEMSFIQGNGGYEESMYDDSNNKKTSDVVGCLHEVENDERNIFSRKVKLNITGVCINGSKETALLEFLQKRN